MHTIESETRRASAPASIDDLRRSLDRRLWTCTAFDHDRDGHARMQARLPEILATRTVHPGRPAADLRSTPRPLHSTPRPLHSTPRPLHSTPRPLRRRFQLPGTQARLLSVPPLAIDGDQLLGLLGTRGLAVWHDGAIVHEGYAHGHTAEAIWPLWSVSKVVVAMLAAAATAHGLIDPETPVAAHWPELGQTAWAEARVGDCLAMASGVAFEEEELDLLADTDQAALFQAVAFGSIDGFLLGLPQRCAPGLEYCYSSADTEVAAGVITRAVGASLAELTERWIWSADPFHAEAVWLCDPDGRAFASGGLAATLRDSLGLGILLSGAGEWGGLPGLADTFSDRLAHPPAALFAKPGADDLPLLLWEQVFVPHDPALQAGDFMAAGTYGQAVYVNPAAGTVIAHHGVDADVTTEYIDFFRLFMACRQIATDLAG